MRCFNLHSRFESVFVSVVQGLALVVICGLSWLALGGSHAQAGLVGHWTFDNTAVDSSLTGQDGTLTNGASYSTTARVGSHSLALDGDNDFVELGTIGIGNPLMLNNVAYSHTAWVYQTAGDQFQRVFDKSDGGAGANGYAMWVDSSGPNGKGFNVATAGLFDGTGPNLGTWEQVTIVNAGAGAGNITIYTNGVQTASFASPGLPPNVATNMRIGTWNHSNAREWRGFLDDVGVWDHPLTAGQAISVYTLSADGDPLGNGADLDYNLSQAESLFDLHTAMGSGLVIDGYEWNYTTGMTSDLGELTKSGDEYFLRLDATTGVSAAFYTAPVPEPSTLSLLVIALLGVSVTKRNRSRKPA